MYEQISRNVRRSWLLILAFVAVVAAVGYGFGLLFGAGPFGVAVAAGIAVVMSIASFRSGDKVVLRISGAGRVTPEEEPRLHNIVEGLSIAGGIPAPRVYVIEDSSPNAFATGRDPAHASIAVTRGLLERMNRIELEGVIAHELSHVRNRDTLVMAIVATLLGVVVLISDFTLRSMFYGMRGSRRSRSGGQGAALFAVVGLALAVLMPLVANVLRFAVSRRREYLADVSGVQLTRYPPGLISALKKLQEDRTVVRTASRATSHLWIESPLQRGAGFMGWLNRLFDTHPPLQDRIRALEDL